MNSRAVETIRKPETAVTNSRAAHAFEDRVTAIHHRLLRSTALPSGLTRPSRFVAMSRCLAAAGPGFSLDDHAVLGDIGLFVFALDDLVDEGWMSPEELELRVEQYAECAAGVRCPEVEFDPLARCLSSIVERLLRAPLGPELLPYWSSAVRAMLQGMVSERRWGGGAARPSLPQYLAAAETTTGVMLVCVAAWILAGETEVLKAWGALTQATTCLSKAVRLANDLRSEERERGGGDMNAVFLVERGGELALLQSLDEELGRGRDRLAAIGARVERSKQFSLQFATAIVELYAVRDFHEEAAPESQVRGRAGTPRAAVRAAG